LGAPRTHQTWGPRFNAYAVPRDDLAVFTLGRLPAGGTRLARARDLAARLRETLDGRRVSLREAARLTGERDPNCLRYAAPTGTVAIRWDGAREPEVWNVPAPAVEPGQARLELARRFLHVFGPATAEAFAGWAGLRGAEGSGAFAGLGRELTRVGTPIGEAWILSRDEPLFRTAPGPAAPVRLLPSGDTWFLLQGAQRELLVPDERRRGELWTSRVWPGALLVSGETAGTWRRAGAVLTVQPWRRLSRAERAAVDTEARALPLPGIDRSPEVRWVAD
jgi:hypothetical protein